MKKNGQDNDVTDYTSVVYAKNESELLWSIWQVMIYDVDQIRQQPHQSYLCWKRNWAMLAD